MSSENRPPHGGVTRPSSGSSLLPSPHPPPHPLGIHHLNNNASSNNGYHHHQQHPHGTPPLSPRHDPQVEYPYQQHRALALSRKMALNRDEAVFVSSAGDVVVCRCRNSSYPQELDSNEGSGTKEVISKAIEACQKDMAAVCCEMDEMSVNAQNGSARFCGDWGTSSTTTNSARRKTYSPTTYQRQTLSRSGGGLLGGSPTQVAAPLQPHSMETAESVQDRAHKAFQSEPLSALESGFDDESIVPIRSFDYSQFSGDSDNQNNSLYGRAWEDFPKNLHQEEKKSESGVTHEPANKETPNTPPSIHGVPTFLSEMAQVKITQVSAHPLGSHVLLISEAGLLYSYGLNEYGQLGLGTTTSVSGVYRGYVMSPTIVTPLVENGGKAIACAAGVSHSLVAVMTEERRLIRSQTSPSKSSKSSRPQATAAVSLAHHQLYGFGRNDYMKIGLVSPKMARNNILGNNSYTTSKDKGRATKDEMDICKLPRRVALRCRVPHEIRDGPNSPPAGIFAIAASETHSAALVHRSKGDVELYTWGNASHGALGLLQQPISGLDRCEGQVNMSPTVRIVPVPSFVAALSRSSNHDAQASSMLLRHHAEYPISISLGKQCTFVATSMGRAFSFGLSANGMLGLGENVVEAMKPQEITAFPHGETVASVSAGATHAVALSSSGSVYAWGTLPQEYFASVDNSVLNTTQDSHDPASRTASPPVVASNHVTWTPEPMETPVQYPGSLKNGNWKKVVAACAGYDSSALVVDSGNVLSCGKSSGRLGLGETKEDVVVPRPLFGGLRLWYQHLPSAQRTKQSLGNGQPIDSRKAPPSIPKPSALVRGSTFG